MLKLAVSLALATFPCFAQSYTVRTVAGRAQPDLFPSTPGPGLGGLALDRAGNVYYMGVASTSVWRIEMATGLVVRVAGNGTPGYSGDGGPATAAQFGAAGVAVDPEGNVYISDALNHRVRRVSNGIITTVVGTGAPGFSGDNGPAMRAQLQSPLGLALDSAGNLYIADGNNYRIRKVTNGVITTVAGTGIPSFNGDNLPALATGMSPSGLAIDPSGNLVFADPGTGRIRRLAGGIVTTLAGSSPDPTRFGGDGGPAVNAQLSGPTAVAVDAAGSLYIADTGNRRVRKVTGGIITTIAGGGIAPGFAGDNGLATNALLSMPSGVAVAPSGTVYVGDGGNYRIRRITNGIIATVFGPGPEGEAGLATMAPLQQPAGIALDGSGNLFAAESNTATIRRIASGVISTFAGGGSLGDGFVAIAARLESPRAVAIDFAGTVYVSDSAANRVRMISGDVITTVAGNGNYGFNGDGIPADQAALASPAGIAVGASGELYIADTNNNRIRKVAHGAISTVAGTGVPGFSGDGGPAIAARLNFPSGIALGSAGDLYIADGDRVRRVVNGIITTVAGTGVPGFEGDEGPAVNARLSGPRGIALDAAGNLYILDSGNGRIRKVSEGIIRTIAGNGSFAELPDTAPATEGGLRFVPFLDAFYGVAVDRDGNVYFAEQGDIRVLVPASTLCSVSARPLSARAPAAGGNVEFTIRAEPACPPTAGGFPDWLSVSSATASDPGLVTLTLFATPNPYESRSAMVFLSGGLVSVQQAGGSPGLTVGALANAASIRSGPVSPGEIVLFSGSGLGPAELVSSQPDESGMIPTELAGTQVFFNGIAAPILFTSSNRVAAVVPYGVPGAAARVTVSYSPAAAGATVLAGVTGAAPGIFTADGSGAGQAVALNEDGSPNSPANPAKAGSKIVLYATGEGRTWPLGTDGKLAADPAPQPFLGISVTIGTSPAEWTYAGGVAGSVAGLFQVHARIPPTIAPGASVPVTLEAGGVSSQPGVTIAIAR